MSPRSQRVAAVVGVLLAAWLLLGPAAWAPTTSYAGQDYLDAYGTVWFYWWFDQALRGASGWVHTDLLFYPWGKDIYLHTGGNLLDAALSWPLRAVLGDVFGTNLWLALVLATNGASAGVLARAAGLGRAGQAAAVGFGLLNPFALFELGMGRWTQALMAPPTLFLAGLVGPPSWRRGLLAGVALALSGLTYWYYGLVGAVMGAAVLGLRLVAGPRRLAEVGRIGLAAAVSLLLTLPAAWPMLAALDGAQVPGLLALSDTPGTLGRLTLRTVEGDVQGLFVLGIAGRAGGLLDETGLTWFPGVRILHLAHLGAALLAAWTLLSGRHRRAGGVALVVLMAAGVIALGPALAGGEGFRANPIYLFAVERLDLLRRWWWPGRAMVYLMPAVALLAALGVDGLRGRWQIGAATALVSGLGIGMVVEGQLPLASWDARVSPGLACLAAAPAGAVIELPYAYDQKNLYHQTRHGKPQLGGMLVTKDAFVPPETTALLRENSFVELLEALGRQQFTRKPEWDPADQAAVVDLGYRYVLARKGAFRRARALRDGTTRWSSDWGRAGRVIAPVLGPPAWEDDAVALYVLEGPTAPGEGSEVFADCPR